MYSYFKISRCSYSLTYFYQIQFFLSNYMRLVYPRTTVRPFLGLKGNHTSEKNTHLIRIKKVPKQTTPPKGLIYIHGHFRSSHSKQNVYCTPYCWIRDSYKLNKQIIFAKNTFVLTVVYGLINNLEKSIPGFLIVREILDRFSNFKFK